MHEMISVVLVSCYSDAMIILQISIVNLFACRSYESITIAHLIMLSYTVFNSTSPSGDVKGGRCCPLATVN